MSLGIIQFEVFFLPRVGVLVGKNNCVTAVDDSEVICIGYGLRKTRRISDSKYAPDAQLPQNGTIDRYLVGAVSVEFRRSLAQGAVFENQLASLPSEHSFDGGRIPDFGRVVCDSKPLARVQELQTGRRLARQHVWP